jgi:hypothetical protein
MHLLREHPTAIPLSPSRRVRPAPLLVDPPYSLGAWVGWDGQRECLSPMEKQVDPSSRLQGELQRSRETGVEVSHTRRHVT